ncbi:MAG: ferrous iron transport protein B [Desulfurivibrionaceae bacterium]|jgi:ferrous iron transport protein B|nr:ferrous iron transport protein B [Desulfobulbaceae bacterium]MDP2002725.1 ferrous iron transport protein B [Desulfurivibrionaceae bacterium]PKN21301.1 MAG: ferrous iron transport protein B [Deltaproteobacteria bacterium HGW-Deltaproteobacteria-3]
MSTITIALAGNPNAGKTTLFNTLTGARQHVGNYPGVTVEKKEGAYTFASGEHASIIDLPGTYSLTAYSVEEVVARDYLVQEKPDVVINITDASNLERNLYLSTQFLELGVPMVIALNMIDVAQDRGISLDAQKLAALLKVPVIPIIARSGKGTAELMEAALDLAKENKLWDPLYISYGEDVDLALQTMAQRITAASFMTESYAPRWLALKYLEGDSQIREKGHAHNPAADTELQEIVDRVAAHLHKTMETYPEAIIADHRYGYIKSVLRQEVITHKFDIDRLYTSDRIDKVLTNRFLGPLIMLGVLLGLYKFTFTFSELPVAWLETFFGWASGNLDALLPEGHLKSMLISGVIDGMGGVLGFVPLIMFMFFGIAILEDSGYLARVAFMMDRVFRIFGLHGSSVMAYIVSGGIAGGCAVPGVMAARTLRSPRERLATLLTVSFMNCGAKLPVLALLTATFFSNNQAQLMFLLTLLAWGVALIAAKFLRLTVLRGDSTPFVMELPPYRFPTFLGLFIHTWERTWQYIKKAGTTILAISILIWAMMTFPGLPATEEENFARQRQEVAALSAQTPEETLQLKEKLAAIDSDQAGSALRHSLAGRIGTSMESVSWLPGFDWRTNIALVGGFAAKEVIVATLGTAYSLGETDPEETASLSETLAKDPHWNPLMAMSLIVFVMFYAPCFVTVVCISRESGSWKWGLFSICFNTAFAFSLATLVYQGGRALGFAG